MFCIEAKPDRKDREVETAAIRFMLGGADPEHLVLERTCLLGETSMSSCVPGPRPIGSGALHLAQVYQQKLRRNILHVTYRVDNNLISCKLKYSIYFRPALLRSQSVAVAMLWQRSPDGRQSENRCLATMAGRATAGGIATVAAPLRKGAAEAGAAEEAPYTRLFSVRGVGTIFMVLKLRIRKVNAAISALAGGQNLNHGTIASCNTMQLTVQIRGSLLAAERQNPFDAASGGKWGDMPKMVMAAGYSKDLSVTCDARIHRAVLKRRFKEGAAIARWRVRFHQGDQAPDQCGQLQT